MSSLVRTIARFSLLVTACALCVNATPLLFTSQSQWNAAISNASPTITFDNLGVATGQKVTAYTETYSNVAFSAFNGSAIQLFATNGFSQYEDWGTGTILSTYPGTGYMELDFTSPVTAVAFNLITLGSWGTDVTILVNGTDTLTAPTNNWTARGSTPAFAGITSTTPITSIRLSTAAYEVAVDNVTTANAGTTGGGGGGGGDTSAAPEPISMSLIGAGLLAIGAAHGRLRKS